VEIKVEVKVEGHDVHRWRRMKCPGDLEILLMATRNPVNSPVEGKVVYLKSKGPNPPNAT